MHFRDVAATCASMPTIIAAVGSARAGEDDANRRNDIVVTGARVSYVPHYTGPLSLCDLSNVERLETFACARICRHIDPIQIISVLVVFAMPLS